MHPARAFKIEAACKELSVFASTVGRQLPEIKANIDLHKPKQVESECYVQDSHGSSSALRTELALTKYRIKELENKIAYMELSQYELSSREYKNSATQTSLVPEFAVAQTNERLAALERELASLLKSTSSLVQKSDRS